MPFELHPDTPLEGAPKPFTDAQWPAIERRLRESARRIGLPIEPPRRNVNSRLALETGELVRVQAGHDASAAFHHAVSRAFFVDGADIADPLVIAKHAEPFGVSEDAMHAAWATHDHAPSVDASMRAAAAAGATGVPAFGWPGLSAISGMMEPEQMLAMLERTTR